MSLFKHSVKLVPFAKVNFNFKMSSTIRNKFEQAKNENDLSEFQFNESVPQNYHDLLSPMFLPYATVLANTVKKEFNFNDSNKMDSLNILELACGTGIMTNEIMKMADTYVTNTSYVASDLSDDMLAVAKNTLPIASCKNVNVKFSNVDMNSIPYADNSFHCLIVSFGFMFCDNKQDVYRECKRVLKPNGKLIFTTWDGLDYNPLPSEMDLFLKHDIIGKQSLEIQQHVKSPMDIPFSMSDFDQIRNDLIAVGFDKNTIDLQHNVQVSTWESVWKAADAFLKGSSMLDYMQSKGVAINVEECRNTLSRRILGCKACIWENETASTSVEDNNKASKGFKMPMRALVGIATKI